MKLFIPFCVMVAASCVYGDDLSRLDEIIQKRGVLLEEIHKVAKDSQPRDSEQVRSTALELYVFRRDTGKTVPERVKWQENILTVARDHVADVKKQMEIGVMRRVDLTRAEERVLAAEQKLLELQLAR